MRRWVMCFSLAVLAGCDGVAPIGEEGVACSADRYAGLEGMPVSASESVPEPKRIIRPGDAVTLEYNPARTNVKLDEDDVIVGVYCG